MVKLTSIYEEKAETEGPFEATIAHGYLTISLILHLWKQIADVRNIKMDINYGIEGFKFGQPEFVKKDQYLTTVDTANRLD